MRLFFAEYLSGLTDEPLDDGLLAQGLLMRDAVLADLVACAARDPMLQSRCAVSPQAPLPPGVRGLQPRPSESATDFVRRQSAEHDVVWLIAPETDELLLRLCEAVPSSKWLGCDADSIRLTTSKSRTIEKLHAANVLTPRTFENDPSVRAWIVKPDDGVGATGARWHTSRATAEQDLARRAQPAVLEHWVEGRAMSLSLLCDGQGGAELLSVNTQAIEVAADGGLVERGVEALGLADATPSLRHLVQQVAQALPGLFGVVGIDYVAHPTRGPVLIEVNPRVTSAYAGLLALGAGSPARSVLDLWRRRHAASASSPALPSAQAEGSGTFDDTKLPVSSVRRPVGPA